MSDDNKLWKKEVNFKQFWHLGYLCTIIRTHLGSLCGYVRVEKDHPIKNIDTFDIPVNVHGGVTWKGNTLPTSEYADGLYIGFDCDHSGDYIPYIVREIDIDGEVYRDMDYVTAQCKSLVEQLLKMKEIR